MHAAIHNQRNLYTMGFFYPACTRASGLIALCVRVSVSGGCVCVGGCVCMAVCVCRYVLVCVCMCVCGCVGMWVCVGVCRSVVCVCAVKLLLYVVWRPQAGLSLNNMPAESRKMGALCTVVTRDRNLSPRPCYGLSSWFLISVHVKDVYNHWET